MKTHAFYRFQPIFLFLTILVCFFSTPANAWYWFGNAVNIYPTPVGSPSIFQKVVKDKDGNVLSMWSSGDYIFKNYHTPGPWSTGGAIEFSNGGDYFDVDMSSNGNVITTHTGIVTPGPLFQLKAKLYLGGSLVSSGVLSNNIDGVTVNHKVAVSDSDSAIVVWANASEIRALVYRAGSWGTELVLDSGYTVDALDVDADEFGNFMVVWRPSALPDNNKIFAKRFTNGIWQGRETVGQSEGGGTEEEPRVAMFGNKKAMVVWEHWRTSVNGNYRGIGSRLYNGSSWETMQSIDGGYSAGTVSSFPLVAVQDDGVAMVVFSQGSSAPTTSIFANRFNGTSWSGPEDIDCGIAGRQMNPDMDGHGNAAMAFYTSANAYYRTYEDGAGWLNCTAQGVGVDSFSSMNINVGDYDKRVVLTPHEMNAIWPGVRLGLGKKDVYINNYDLETSNANVTLLAALAFNDICFTSGAFTQVRFSNNGTSWSAWQAGPPSTFPYTDTYTWNITNATYGGNSLPGYKSVYVQYRNATCQSLVTHDYILYNPPLDADLSVTKTASPSPATVGDPLTYYVTVVNNGPDAATQVQLYDQLPAGVEYSSRSITQGTCSGPNIDREIVCDVGMLGSGASATLQINVTPLSAGSITNYASANAFENDPNVGNNDVSVFTLVNQPMIDLSIVKTDSPDPVLAGNNITYTISVRNVGSETATNVRVSDVLPLNLSFVSYSTTLGSCSGPDLARKISCNLGTMTSLQTATITIVASTSSAGTVTNTATVTANEADSNTSNNTSTTSTLVKDVIANLVLSKSANLASLLIGETLVYTLTVNNLGPQTASNVQLTDTLPTNVSFLSSVTSQGSCVGPIFGIVNCSLGSILSGGSASVTIRVQALAVGNAVNTATVAGDEVDNVPDNNTATVTTKVVAPSANLSISKIANPEPATVGQSLTYEINVSNAGPQDATNVVMVDTLPSSVLFDSITSTSAVCVGPNVTNEVTCSLASMLSGATEVITLVVTPQQVGLISNTADVSADESDSNPGDNTVTVVSTVNEAVIDNDGDGHPAGEDCDDNNDQIWDCNTPVGSDPVIFNDPAGNASVTINGVTAGGDTVISSAPCDPAEPVPGFILAGNAICVNITSDSTFDNAKVCITYDPVTVTTPFTIIQHCPADGVGPCEYLAPDSPPTIDPITGLATACATVTHFSEFSVGGATDGDGDFVPDLFDNCPTVHNIAQGDGDGDGVGNLCDNCSEVANPDQRDTNGDGYGNICDADLNDDGGVNFADMGILRQRLFSADPDADFNGDGGVNFGDMGILRQYLFGPPGPSGLVP